MAARTIDGPEKDWLNLADVLRHTGLSKSSLYRLIEQGKFPSAAVITAGVKKWHWDAIVYWNLYVRYFGRPEAQDRPEDASTIHGP